MAGRSLRRLGRTCLFTADYRDARPSRPLRAVPFYFVFSRPPWLIGVHDFMFHADLTALMSHLEQGFHSSFHAF